MGPASSPGNTLARLLRTAPSSAVARRALAWDHLLVLSAAQTTIAAIASPPGSGERGVVRVSGPRARKICSELHAGRERDAAGRFFDGPRGQRRSVLDDGAGEQPALVVWTPAPRSYTAEDVCELHVCGAPALQSRLLERLFALGAAPAGPGEFTRRAFLNGRIDLTRAEGVLEMIEAGTEAERRAAAELLEGGLAERVGRLRDGLDDLRALCEASLDFDESDTGHVPLEDLQRDAERVEAGLREALDWEVRRVPASGLPRVVLVGAPNAGKSSLFNALLEGPEERDVEAVVSPVAGSTRDGVVGRWSVGNVECHLADAPGLDGAAEGADARAQELAAHERSAADLCLWIVDGTRSVGPDEWAVEEGALPPAAARVLVRSKLDLVDPDPDRGAAPETVAETAPDAVTVAEVAVSARTGAGLRDLERAAAAALGLGNGAERVREGEADSAGGRPSRELSARHREALARGLERLGTARSELAAGAPLDFVAETLREATRALDSIRGSTTSEDLLGRIFARFCIGK